MSLQRMEGDARPALPWLRLGLLMLVLMLCILVPFGLWGDALDRTAPQWLADRPQALSLALLGIALLVADVLLPIPSSVVGMALCWTLGPLWGGISLACGLTLAFVLGYALGRLLPEARLRQWVGAALWDRVRGRASRRALWWIALARPLPLLAEMSSLLAGVWRVPPVAACLSAAASSTAVAALYAASVWLGQQEPETAMVVLSTLAVPALAWTVDRIVVARLRRARTDARRG